SGRGERLPRSMRPSATPVMPKRAACSFSDLLRRCRQALNSLIEVLPRFPMAAYVPFWFLFGNNMCRDGSIQPLDIEITWGKIRPRGPHPRIEMPQNQLLEIREKRGLTQAELAEKLHTTPQTIGRYEKQDQRLDLPLLTKLARVLKCS